MHVDVPFQSALGIYTVAAVAGLVSLAPGGIGGFDLIALLGLQALGYPPEKSVQINSNHPEKDATLATAWHKYVTGNVRRPTDAAPVALLIKLSI
ncbi:lysylphosphatidylglycerol synthase domain-containing protein [Paenibacillus riograndensis]|uniref:lysylphosphatidylglycerol synthase domain-containing protein n=1 Tax=Paenibacillus riograndensis TaxID=483937 RepID=UPI0005937DAE|nr:lysylphosphatidylglycerol synthase domain-containing protein [Paenibacillus riograndensis]